ncbi:hypothetical protein ACWEP3_29150, partial [Streptomyces albidoflavus]
MKSTFAAVLPDLSPWRSSRDFRLLWGQGLITFFGSTMALVALPLQIKELTGSPLAVGAMPARRAAKIPPVAAMNSVHAVATVKSLVVRNT